MELSSQGTDLVLETDHIEPQVFGVDRTRRLYTYVYGVALNGHTDSIIASSCRAIFNIDIDEMDVHHIIGAIEFEARIASRQVGFHALS